MRTVNELDGFEARATFEDALGNSTIPGTVHWRVVCVTTKKTLQDWTAVTPETTTEVSGLSETGVNFDVPGSVNAIQVDRNAREQKELHICTDKDLSSQFTLVVPYFVRNLQGR